MLPMQFARLIVCALAVGLFASAAHAQSWTSHRADGHAPLGVMGDHTHSAGEIMVSYRYMLMDMSGSVDGTASLTDAEIVDPAGAYQFMVTPTAMPMQMHMLGMMWAPTNSLTLMGMVPYLSNSMDHVTRMSVMADPEAVAFTTGSSGIGDVKLSALYVLARPGRQRVHAHVGVSLPTGSIEAMDVTPASMGNEVQLPYPMQLGSGTVDLLPGLTYLGQTDQWSWGAQASGTIRLGENDRAYRLGHVGGGTVWGARQLSENFSVSVRSAVKSWGDVEGADAALNPMMVPTADPTLRNGTRVDVGLGVNFAVFHGTLDGFRIAAEIERPVYQSLDGPQLETDLMLTVGAQWAFDLR